MPGPGGPWGDAAGRRGRRRPGPARRRSTTRCCGCCGSPPGSAPWTASSRRADRRPVAAGRGRGRAAGRAPPPGSCWSATPGDAALLCPGPFGPAPGGRARPQRRGRADPRRRQRHGVPALHRLAGRGPAGRPGHGRRRSTTAGGVRSTDRLPVAPMALLRRPDGGGAGVEVRFLAADGTVRGREDRTSRRLQLAQPLRPRPAHRRGRRRRGPHPPARPRTRDLPAGRLRARDPAADGGRPGRLRRPSPSSPPAPTRSRP